MNAHKVFLKRNAAMSRSSALERRTKMETSVLVVGKRGSQAFVFELCNVPEGEGIDRAERACAERGITYRFCLRTVPLNLKTPVS